MIFGVSLSAIHFWRVLGRFKKLTRKTPRGRFVVSRQEVIRLLAEERRPVPGLWKRPKRVLIVDDDEKIRKLIETKFHEWKVPLELALAANLEAAQVLGKKFRPHAIVLDYFLSEEKKDDAKRTAAFIGTAIDLFKAKVIGISAWPDVEGVMRSAGAVEFFAKPFHLEDLKNAILKHATADRRGQRERRRREEVIVQDVKVS